MDFGSEAGQAVAVPTGWINFNSRGTNAQNALSVRIYYYWKKFTQTAYQALQLKQSQGLNSQIL